MSAVAANPAAIGGVAAAVAPPLPYAFARRHGVVVRALNDSGAVLVCRPDTHSNALLEARRYLRVPIAIVRVSVEEFDRVLQAIYEHGARQAQELLVDFGDAADLSQLAKQLSEPTDLLEHADDAPIIRLINALLSEAIRENASDIHFESFESRVCVRLRVDGVLRTVLEPPRTIGPTVVSRIKVMAKLDIAEKRLPQDGRISLRIANRPVDVRVSTLPCGHGERVVLRLLDKQAGRLRLEQIGMAEAIREAIDGIIRQPHGIFLVTGPTGSGKTTTLYAALSRLNDQTRNVMTVEDPIEYFIDGIAQSQVNTKVELTFARGLRAILRQDPDVVMVGEIRDIETAQIAVQASLTGHLVLSTLHTNSAIGAITRLRDMGTEPFLLSSSLRGVLAQRLVRLLCEHCKQARSASDFERTTLGITAAAAAPIYSAAGCSACRYTGYRGRTGIYELVVIDASMRQMIHDGAGEHELDRYARGLTPGIAADGYSKVRGGLTTLEEVTRISCES
jgi:general secretion pathway protein E